MIEFEVILEGKKREEVFFIWAENSQEALKEAMQSRTIKSVVKYEIFYV